MSTPQPPMRYGADGGGGVVVDNRTGLPDGQVLDAVRSYWVESAGLQLGQPPSTFQLYSSGTAQGSLLAKVPFRTPNNVIEEIRLARQVADTDDDIGATIGQMIATAFGSGMKNLHEDEKTLGLFNEIGKDAHIDMALKEMYREYLISSQVVTISLFMRKRMSYTPSLAENEVNTQISAPLVGVLPSENIRVVSNDVFGQGDLAYKPTDLKVTAWLREFFGAATTPARRERMRQDDPIMAALFTAEVQVDWNDDDMFSAGQALWVLNPRMVHRTTMPKGASPYPRPLLTRNFALLEAKRLLSIMDYALLQGGTNYIVIAKVGSDNLPAKQPEVDNLVQQVTMASHNGILVGDHRVTMEIVTPDLTELLNREKRILIGRKLAMALLRIPEQVTNDPGTGGAQQELTYTENTITSDRQDIRCHMEEAVYEETANRNRATFPKGAPTIWFPQIKLQGTKDFYSAVLQARDRGDIPRRWATESLGFDYDAALAERKREVERGDDEVLTPASVPWSQQPGGKGAPGQADPYAPAPGDVQGRPAGSSSNNGRSLDSPSLPSVRPRQLIQRTRGETIRAFFNEEEGRAIRVGELTHAVLEEYPEAEVGRMTAAEREAIESGQAIVRGPVAVVPVNPGYEAIEMRAFRLEDGLSLCIGQRRDGAIVAKAVSFREPHWSLQRGEETARRWGFPVELTDSEAGATACANCGMPLSEDPTSTMGVMCQNCGMSNRRSPEGTMMTEMARLMAEMMKQSRPFASSAPIENADIIGLIELAKTDGRYIYVKCPECGLIQDAANDTCTRCGHDLTNVRKAMFAQYNRKGEDPVRHKNPPPPASQQPDRRKENNGGS